MKRIGIEPGKSFDKSKVAPDIAEALKDVPAEAQKLMDWKIATLARVANNATGTRRAVQPDHAPLRAEK